VPKRDNLSLRATTIVVKLSGEMGNNLCKFATGRGLQVWAKQKYGIDTRLVVRHQDARKWVSASENVKRCFPNLRQFDYELGNTKEYDTRKRQQERWLGDLNRRLIIESAQEDEIEEGLRTLHQILSWNNVSVSAYNESEANITLPYMKADYLSMLDVWVDRYYDEYRRYFMFDGGCCKLKPHADESVFVSS
jgi:hypothetical protein